MIKFILCGVYLLFSVMGLTFMKLGNMEGRTILFTIGSLQFTVLSFIGYACYALSFLLYTIVITKFDLTYIVPILGGCVNVLILLVGVYYLNENLTKLSIFGCILVILGIIIMNFNVN